VGNIVQLMAFVRQILQATLFVRMYLDLSRDIKTTETRHGHAPPRRTGFWIDDQKLSMTVGCCWCATCCIV